jgi:hypothetical protein
VDLLSGKMTKTTGKKYSQLTVNIVNREHLCLLFDIWIVTAYEGMSLWVIRDPIF